MSSRQLNFYADAVDFEAIESRLRAKFEFLLLDDSQGRIDFANQLFKAENRQAGSVLFMIRPSDIDSLICGGSGDGKRRVDSSFSPVIEITSGLVTQDRAHRSRLYFKAGFFDKDGIAQRKNDDFIKWAERVFRAAKLELIKGPSFFYLGKNLAHRMTEHDIVLEPI